jgi:hypothetical protein
LARHRIVKRAEVTLEIVIGADLNGERPLADSREHAPWWKPLGCPARQPESIEPGRGYTEGIEIAPIQFR